MTLVAPCRCRTEGTREDHAERRPLLNLTSVNLAEDYPPGLARAEFRGMTAGPLAYLRARRARSLWRR